MSLELQISGGWENILDNYYYKNVTGFVFSEYLLLCDLGKEACGLTCHVCFWFRWLWPPHCCSLTVWVTGLDEVGYGKCSRSIFGSQCVFCRQRARWRQCYRFLYHVGFVA